MGESFKSKMPLAEATVLGEKLVHELLDAGIEWAMVCGSVRRRKPEVGDLDIVVIGDLSKLRGDGKPWRFVDGGQKKCTVDYHGRQVNVLATNITSLGASLLYFTGNATLNLIMRRKAKAKGWKLNEYGLWDGDRLITADETRIFIELGMEPKLPHERSV